jgi:hypothetical protein
VSTSTEAKDIATVRLEHAELVADAYAVQTEKRELSLALGWTLAKSDEVREARRHLAAARRLVKTLRKENRTCR